MNAQSAFEKIPSLTEDLERTGLPVPVDPLEIYLTEVRKHPVMSREEELEVARRAYEEGDRDAAQRLVLSNLRLVIRIALEYCNNHANLLDLVQEGNFGLLRSMTNFDHRRGTRFSTYASFWIRAYVLKHLMDSWSLVKVGTTQGQRRLFYNLHREMRKLEASGIYPSTGMIAHSLRVREQEVCDMQLRLSLTDISLHTPVHDDPEEMLMDTLASDEDVEETVCNREESFALTEKIRQFKETLNERDRYIFEQRILTEDPMLLSELGKKFAISRERVRQVEEAIKNRLKNWLTSTRDSGRPSAAAAVG